MSFAPTIHGEAEEWPDAENVYIYTTASTKEVEAWVAELAIDGVVEGWPYGEPATAPRPVPGYRVLTLCWD